MGMEGRLDEVTSLVEINDRPMSNVRLACC